MKPAIVNLHMTKGDSFSKTFTIFAQSNLKYRGKWSSELSYKVNDLVVNGGVLYYCTAANTGQEPPNVTYWDTPTPLDLSTATITSKIRADLRDAAELASFTTALVTDGTDGKFSLALTSAVTTALDFTKAFYDVQIVIGSNTTTYIKGQIDFDLEATY